VTEYDARDGEIRTYTVTPEEFGLVRATADQLQGGGVAENVAIARAILAGANGPRRSITLLNAGAGIYAANAAPSYAAGIAMAAEAIDSGRAQAKLEQLADLSASLVEVPEAVFA
jgi:anthranilate phosphoribosyltransferase